MITRLGSDLAAWLVPVNAWTLALLAGALLLDRALVRRLRASLRIALYAPVALRVLVPLSWSVPVAHVPRLAVLLPAEAVSGASSAAPVGDSRAHAALALVYLGVALLLGALAVGRRVRLALALRESRTWSLPGQAHPIVLHPELGPLVAGLWRPRIVVPEAMVDGHGDAALSCVLEHEGAHIRRGDPWFSAALDALLVLGWPVAPLWVASARVRHLVELACDEAALAGADAAQRRRYGHVLLDLAERGPLLVGGTAALHFGSTLRARIEAIAMHRPWSRPVQWALVAGAVTAFAACSSAGPEALPQASDGTHPAAGASSLDRYGYQFEYEHSSRAAPSPPAGEAPAEARDEVEGHGRLAPEAIQGVVHQNWGRFRTCYENATRTNPKLAGRVTVSYVIRPDGATQDAKDLGSTLPDASVVECVVGGFAKLSYPPPDGGYVTVVYPIEFSP
jgi:beta-lactamase regulating signal transducer with metallopeptidase domain